MEIDGWTTGNCRAAACGCMQLRSQGHRTWCGVWHARQKWSGARTKGSRSARLGLLGDGDTTAWNGTWSDPKSWPSKAGIWPWYGWNRGVKWEFLEKIITVMWSNSFLGCSASYNISISIIYILVQLSILIRHGFPLCVVGFPLMYIDRFDRSSETIPGCEWSENWVNHSWDSAVSQNELSTQRTSMGVIRCNWVSWYPF